MEERHQQRIAPAAVPLSEARHSGNPLRARPVGGSVGVRLHPPIVAAALTMRGVKAPLDMPLQRNGLRPSKLRWSPMLGP